MMDHGFTMTVQGGAEAPDWEDFDGSSWTVTLHRRGHSYTLAFHQGSAHTGEPKIKDVLHCVISDVAGYDQARSFEEWCAEYGYDDDSRRAERIYKAVGHQAAGMYRLIGDDMDELLEMFQDY